MGKSDTGQKANPQEPRKWRKSRTHQLGVRLKCRYDRESATSWHNWPLHRVALLRKWNSAGPVWQLIHKVRASPLFALCQESADRRFPATLSTWRRVISDGLLSLAYSLPVPVDLAGRSCPPWPTASSVMKGKSSNLLGKGALRDTVQFWNVLCC